MNRNSRLHRPEYAACLYVSIAFLLFHYRTRVHSTFLWRLFLYRHKTLPCHPTFDLPYGQLIQRSKAELKLRHISYVCAHAERFMGIFSGSCGEYQCDKCSFLTLLYRTLIALIRWHKSVLQFLGKIPILMARSFKKKRCIYHN